MQRTAMTALLCLVSGLSTAAVTPLPLSALPVITTVAVPAGPGWLGVGFGSVWLSKSESDLLLRIDPATNRVAATIQVGFPGPGGDLWVEDGMVWASAEGAPINMIDPKTNTLVKQFVGGKRMDTLRAGFGAVWVIEELSGKVWKVGIEKLKPLR